MLLVGTVGEVGAQLEKGAICTLNVRPDVLVDAGYGVCCEHFDDHVALAGLGPDAKVYDLAGLVLVRVHVRLHFDRFIRVEFIDVDHASCFLELLLELFANGDQLTVLDNLLGELVEELLLGHGIEPVQIVDLLEARVLPKLVVVGLVAQVNRFEWHSVGVLRLQIVREVAVQDVRQNRLRNFESKKLACQLAEVFAVLLT